MPETVLFGISLIVLVAAAFLYLKREDNDYVKLLELLNTQSSRLAQMEKRLSGDDFKSMQEDLVNLKSRQANLEKKSVDFTPTVNVVLTKPVSVVMKEVPSYPAKKTPLLDRAGITKKRITQ